MKNSEIVDNLNKQLEEIKSANDLDILYNYCKKLYFFIDENKLGKFYRKRVDDFNNFRQTKEYKECLTVLLEDIQNLINIESLSTEYNLYLVAEDLEKFNAIPFYPNLIQIFSNMYSQFNDGLIKSYELIMGVLSYAKENNLYDLENIFNDPYVKMNISSWDISINSHVDYFIFDNFFNPNFDKEYFASMDEEFGNFVHMAYAEHCKPMLSDYNILKIIATKIINDTIEDLSYMETTEKAEENVLSSKNHSLNDTELQILAIRKNWDDVNSKATHKNIGEKLNPPLSESNVTQKVLSIKNKLIANSIDDAIRIMETEYNYKF